MKRLFLQLAAVMLGLSFLLVPAQAKFKKAIDANIKYDSDIVMYTGPECMYCDAAKEYFKEKGLDYAELNVMEDKEAAAELELFGGTSVPVIVFKGKVLQGFSRAYMEEALAREEAK